MPNGGMMAYQYTSTELNAGSSVWLSPIAYDSSVAAQSALALPESNTALFVTPVWIPGGWYIQYGTAPSRNSIMTDLIDHDGDGPQRIIYAEVHFICEHDGEPERRLKRDLVDCFRFHAQVERAYLAAFRTANSTPSVGIFVRASAQPTQDLLQTIGRIISGMFVKQTKIDLMYLDHAREQSLRGICNPLLFQEGFT